MSSVDFLTFPMSLLFFSLISIFQKRSPTVFSSPPPGKPFDPIFLLSRTVSNVICCMVFGQRFSYDDKKFLHLLDIMSGVLRFNSGFVGQVSCFLVLI